VQSSRRAGTSIGRCTGQSLIAPHARHEVWNVTPHWNGRSPGAGQLERPSAQEWIGTDGLVGPNYRAKRAGLGAKPYYAPLDIQRLTGATDPP
jgi:hypothetical protein